MQIIDTILLPDHSGRIVLYDWMAVEVNDGQNLMRIDVKGNIVWKASPPQGKQDCFTRIEWDGHALTAQTWSCYRVRVDLASGDVSVLFFTK